MIKLLEKFVDRMYTIYTSIGNTFAYKKKVTIFASEFAGVAQLVEHDLAKVGVAGSSPVSRSYKAATIYRGGFLICEKRQHVCTAEEQSRPLLVINTPVFQLLINIILSLFGTILNKIIFVLITEERVPLHGWD
jgi:hypothetical protein